MLKGVPPRPAMRYLKRTQRVSIGFVNDVLNREPSPEEGRVTLLKAATSEQKGDHLTKAVPRATFERALEMIRWRPIK